MRHYWHSYNLPTLAKDSLVVFNPPLLGVAWQAIHEVPFEVVPLYARKAHVRKFRELHFMSPASYQTAGPGGAAPQIEKHWPQRKMAL